jgi:P27 family predicted phage terminase small subunit
LRLAKDAAAAWRRIVPTMDGLGLLSTIDHDIITDYCVCWARLLYCERKLSEEGMAQQGERGVQKNPHLTAANQYRSALKAYIAELGLGPSSRGRMTVPERPDGEESPFDV